MLQNAYLLAKIGADTAENERKFADNCQKLANFDSTALHAAAAAGVAATCARLLAARA